MNKPNPTCQHFIFIYLFYVPIEIDLEHLTIHCK